MSYFADFSDFSRHRSASAEAVPICGKIPYGSHFQSNVGDVAVKGNCLSLRNTNLAEIVDYKVFDIHLISPIMATEPVIL